MKRLFMVFMLTVLFICFTNLDMFAVEMNDDEFLLQVGMPQNEIDNLDPDVKAFMINSLLENSEISELEYVHIDVVPTKENRVNQVLSGISFSASAFKNGNRIYIYPTYEFTRDIRPRGGDSFSFQFGDAIIPYQYGGQMWYKDSMMSSWTSGGSMYANTQNSNGAEYSGSQLGSPSWDMKIKGCAYAYADVGSGTDKRIIMSYMHNPNRKPYSISLSAYGIGITYNSSSDIYTAASTKKLSY